MGARIYLASLTDYNAGELHGEWFDLAEHDHESLMEALGTMLEASPTAAEEGSVAEEWAIHDYEGFGAYKVGEYDNLEILVELADKLDEVDGYAFTLYIANHGTILGDPADVDTAWDEFTDSYIGEMEIGTYAYDYIQESGMLEGVPETIAQYFDYDQFARDLRLGGDVWESDGHLFHSY